MYQPDPTIRSQGQAGSGTRSLVETVTAGAPRVVLIDTYHAPGSEEFLTRLRAEWPGEVSWFDTRQALKEPRRQATFDGRPRRRGGARVRFAGVAHEPR